MTPQPWQTRLIQERAELLPKLDSLVAFLESSDARAIPPADRELLLEQRRAMTAYATTLKHRIERFQKAAD